MSPVVRIPSCGRRLALLLLLVPLSCLFRGNGPKIAISDGGSPRWTLLQVGEEMPRLGRGLGILAMASRSRALPEAWRTPAFQQGLRQWIHQGGCLLLLGYAAGFAEDLGLAGRPRVGAQVLGRRGNRTAAGMRFGLDLDPALASSMQLPPAFDLGGGTHARLEYCLFDEETRGSAKVLGTYYRRTGEGKDASALAGLLEWPLGKGCVLALGISPLSTPQARGLLAALSTTWSRGRPGAWVALPVVPPDPVVDRWVQHRDKTPLPALHDVPGGLPDQLAHFGLSMPIGELVEARKRGIVDEALSRGSDLFLTGASDGPAQDLVPELRDLATALHEKCALLAVQGVPAGQRAAVAECVDGIGLRWPASLARGGLAGSWDRRPPGTFLLGSDPEPLDSPASVGEILPEAGRVGDLPIRGLVDPELSRAFPPRLFSLLHLDPDPAHGGHVDWLVAQVRDFVRHRPDEASGVVLDFESATEASRQAWLLDTLRRPFASARSYRLSATGKGGQRQALADLESSSGGLLRALSEAPCSRMVLENRFVRLEGTEGSLLVDREHAADFGPGNASRQVLSKRFMTTRLRGARPGPAFLVEVHERLRPTLESGSLDAEALGDERRLSLPAPGDLLPRYLRADGVAIVDKVLQLPVGDYELRLSARSRGKGSLVEIRIEGEVLGFLSCSGGENVTRSYRFGIAQERPVRLTLQHRHGDALELVDVEYDKVGDAGIEVRTPPGSGPRAVVVEELGSSFLSERRRLVTLGDLPALCLEVDYGTVSTGLRVDRFFSFEGYELGRHERLEGGTKILFRLEDPSGVKPALLLVASGLGRDHHLAFLAREGLAMRSYPRANGGFRLGLVLADQLGTERVEAQQLWAALDDLMHPPTLQWQQGQRAFAWPWDFVWRRCALVPGNAARPIQLLEGGTWRGVTTGTSGDQGESLLVAGGPGEGNALSLGEWMGPRPLPGSARLISYDLETREVVLSRLSVLCPRPGVLLDTEVGSATLDGRPWDYHYADKVWLPRVPGRYRIGRPGGSGFHPSLIATTGNVQKCRYDRQTRVLSVFLSEPRSSDKSSDRLFPLEIRGPRPASILGALLADPVPQEQGVLRLMARPGEVRIRFDEPAAPGR